MSEAMTYDSLVNDIITYAERSDSPFLEQIPRFIMLAENRLASEIRGLGHLRFASFDMSPGEAVYAKPARWRETYSVSYVSDAGLKFLNPRGYSYCRVYWPDPSLTDSPEFYSDYDYEHTLIVPTPDAQYVSELAYFERPAPLSTENQTNWTTRYAPQVLLYAALLEAQPFLKNQRAAEFQALYDRAVESLNNENDRRLADSATRR